MSQDLERQLAEPIELTPSEYVEKLVNERESLFRVNAALRAEVAEAISVCRPIDQAAAMKSPFWEPDWNPKSHVEITLTIAECRAIRAFLNRGSKRMFSVLDEKDARLARQAALLGECREYVDNVRHGVFFGELAMKHAKDVLSRIDAEIGGKEGDSGT